MYLKDLILDGKNGEEKKEDWENSRAGIRYQDHTRYLNSYCVKASLTQVIESPVHDAGFCGIDGLDLISPQRPGRKSVVIMLPPVETTETNFGPTP